MEFLQQKLGEISLTYSKFEETLSKTYEEFQKSIDELVVKNDHERTPNPKGKRAKRLQQPIQESQEEEEESMSSAFDTSNETAAQRPQRSARTKNATCYKEPSLVSKIRRPSPLKEIKKERISTCVGKENTAPNNETVVLETTKNAPPPKPARLTKKNSVNNDESQKRKSEEEDTQNMASSGAKKVKLSDAADAVEIVESPKEPVTEISDDEAEKMPPPSMPAPKTRGRPRTRKQTSKQSSEESMPEVRVKVERISTLSDKKTDVTSSSGSSRSARTKNKKIPKPIVEVKSEKVSLEATSGVVSDASVYEDAQGNQKNSVPALDGTYTKGDTPKNSTITIENATFNVPTSGGAIANNETFQVQSPQDVNGTYTVPVNTGKNSNGPNPHDSIMTEDRSDDESAVITKTTLSSIKQINSDSAIQQKHIPNSKKYEIFNPNIPSPVKTRVQAFEKFMSPAVTSKTRQMGGSSRQLTATPGTSKIATPLTLPKLPNFKAITPLSQINTLPLPSKTGSTSKAIPSTKSAKSTSRDPSVEDLKRTQAAIAEKKKARDEKQRLAHLQRQQIEKERQEKVKLLQKEKEEKHRRLLQEKEDRKREVMNQKKLEEQMRAQKIMEQKRRELAEKEALEAVKAKQNESLQRKVLQKQYQKNYSTKHDFDTLDTDDSTDDEGKMNKNRAPPPIWSKGSIRKQTIREQAYINLKLTDTFFSVQPMTPDLKEIFPTIEPRKLKRNSSAVWRTPPRYSEIPKY